jgi:hypothetical protein
VLLSTFLARSQVPKHLHVVNAGDGHFWVFVPRELKTSPSCKASLRTAPASFFLVGLTCEVRLELEAKVGVNLSLGEFRRPVAVPGVDTLRCNEGA